MDSLNLLDPPATPERGGDRPWPLSPDFEPRILMPEGGELSPWQKLQLDREYVHLGQTAAETQIKKAAASAEIRDHDENRVACHRDLDERRASELETEKWERVDRRVERYAMVAVFLLATIAAITLSFLGLGSSHAEARIIPSAPVGIAIMAGLRLRALRSKNALQP